MFISLRGALLALLLVTPHAQASEPAPDAMLRIANRDIVALRATVAEQTPAERVVHISARIDQQPATSTPAPITLQPLNFQGHSGYALVQQRVILMALFQDDLAPDDPPLANAAETVRQRLMQALEARDEQDNPRRVAMAIGLTLLAGIGLAGALWLLAQGRRRGNARLQAQVQKLPLSTLQLILLNIERLLLGLTHVLLALFFAYSCLAFILLQYPYTQPWGQQLGASVLNLAGHFGDSMLNAVPGLCTVAAIFLLTRLIQRGLNLVFSATEQQNLKLPGLYPETLGATRRLSGVVLWLFALSLAYPYLPGSDSEAFKGVSVFFGLMVSLGSAGIVNQAMSGLVLVYSRALKPGDWVQLGEVEGKVSQLGPLSTKIVNRLAQEITLPNAVITSGKIVNHSRLTQEQGMVVSTTVTIGYDTPWRQVHALLELAARRTPSLRQDPAPRVRQLALQDFYIAYELAVHIQPGTFKPDVLDALHAQIQDVFNQFGVQIMSPNFVMQPEKNVVVPEADWYAAPARSENKSAGT